jgi:hypothetical protein
MQEVQLGQLTKANLLGKGIEEYEDTFGRHAFIAID